MQRMGREVEMKEEGDREGSLCFGRDAIGEARGGGKAERERGWSRR